MQMPYLHWDTRRCFDKRAKFMEATLEGKHWVPQGLENQRQSLYEITRDYLNEGSSLHPRRSLDQFFYSRLSDTTTRDNDQVVSKHTLRGPGGPKMIMVDQLWLWVIKPVESEAELKRPNGDSASGYPEACELPKHESLVTFFPKKECKDSGGERDMHCQIADLQQRILDELGEKRCADESVDYLAAITIQQAVEAMFEERYESLDFLEIFRAAIGDAVSQNSSIPEWLRLISKWNIPN
jgi:hypothetical protein